MSERLVVFPAPPRVKEIWKEGPGELTGPAHNLPPVLRAFIESLLPYHSVVQTNDAEDAQEARWVTLTPDGSRILLFWLESPEQVKFWFLRPTNVEVLLPPTPGGRKGH
jgi:hypothetical protein